MVNSNLYKYTKFITLSTVQELLFLPPTHHLSLALNITHTHTRHFLSNLTNHHPHLPLIASVHPHRHHLHHYTSIPPRIRTPRPREPLPHRSHHRQIVIQTGRSALPHLLHQHLQLPVGAGVFVLAGLVAGLRFGGVAAAAADVRVGVVGGRVHVDDDAGVGGVGAGGLLPGFVGGEGAG